MGTSHFSSSVEAHDGTETIAGFSEISATTLTDGTTSLSAGAITGATSISGTTVTDGTAQLSGGVVSGATSVRATNYVQIGDSYLFLGSSITTNAASILAAASSLVTTASLKGSMFISASPVSAWVFTATNTCATLSGLGV